MATLRTKGPRDARRVYVRYEFVIGGERRQRERLLKGIAMASSRAARQELARVEREVQAGRDPFPPLAMPKLVGPLLERFRDSLANRSAGNDKSRLNLHVLPRWQAYELPAIDLPAVMDWLDELKASKLGVQTQRHAFNLLSRFFSWCIERGLATVNPARMVPSARRPVPARASDGPWLEDDTKVPVLMAALGGDLGLMFYLANRSGLRLGEVCGLRMGDLEFFADGVIRVGHSYDGPLKEDRKGEGKTKWVPAPVDVKDVMGLHLKRRRLQGAKPDDLVFVAPVREKGKPRTSGWRGYTREYIDDQWRTVAEAAKLPLTWYQATRHTFVSRNLRDGASLDEVSAAVGHSLPAVTQRHYNHYVRRVFSPGLRRGLA